MLEPKDRLLLFEALRPPEGFRFDQGIGTTYSLDLLALLTAPLAFTWFDQQGDEGQKTSVDSLEILESLRRHADQLSIFCHAGRIALPKTFYPQLAFIEDSVIGCQPHEGGAFHPKVWALRWVNDDGAIRYRVLCLSRNLTFSRAWDSLLALDGILQPDRKSAIGRNRGLVDFVRSLPGFAGRTVSPVVAKRIVTLSGELERTEFDLPDGMTDLRFWPLGIGGKKQDPLNGAGERLLVVSPFVTLGRLEELSDGRKNVTLVSTASALAHLARQPKGVKKFFCLLDRAMLEVDPEGEEKPESEAEAIQQSDLHAKLYVSEVGWDAHVWTGSANATSAAFSKNVEFLIELVGPRKRFGIDALMETAKGEVRFVNLLEDAARFVASEQEDEGIKALEQKLEVLREGIASSSLHVEVVATQSGTFELRLVCGSTPGVSLDGSVTLRCWPVTVASTIGTALQSIEAGQTLASFPSLTFKMITAFFAFELTGRASGQQRQERFVLNLPLLGAPEGRREQVLRAMLQDRTKMLRFLWLLLADEGAPVPEMSSEQDRLDSNGTLRPSTPFVNGLFEMLLRNLDRSPERLDHLASLMKELRHGADGEDLLPVGFDEIWEPIWKRREQLRARSTP